MEQEPKPQNKHQKIFSKIMRGWQWSWLCLSVVMPCLKLDTVNLSCLNAKGELRGKEDRPYC